METHLLDCQNGAGSSTQASQVPYKTAALRYTDAVMEEVENTGTKQTKALEIYIMEKDSKKFYIYNTST